MIRLREISSICQRETECVPRQLFCVCGTENMLEAKSEYPHSSGGCTGSRRCGAVLEVDLDVLRRVMVLKTKICKINKNQCALYVREQSGRL